MIYPVYFKTDIRNYIHLIEEQSGTPSPLLARYNELKEVPETDPRSQSLEKDVLSTAESLGESATEPSGLEEILGTLPPCNQGWPADVPQERIASGIAGGWRGRIAGCILGKPVECLMAHADSRAQLTSLLKESDSWPLEDFVSERTMARYYETRETPRWFHNIKGILREYIEVAEADDDLNYTILALLLVKRYGRTFTPDNVLDFWLQCLPCDAACSAEKIGYRNRAMGLSHPQTARFANPYSEWIGAQIRADLYGYCNPGNPRAAAVMAWQDAAATHVRNGIYGAMWTAAAIAVAFTEDAPVTIILQGLEQVPPESRFSLHMRTTVEECRKNGSDCQKTFEDIERRLGNYHCVHTINNACVVAAALVHGAGDFGKTICNAVMGGLDTDCNGATAGSIAGVYLGEDRIPSRWVKPFNDRLNCSIAGKPQYSITELIEDTIHCAVASNTVLAD